MLLPAGTFLSGTIYMKSNVALSLDSGCILLGSPDIDDYPHNIPAIRSYSDNYTTQSLIAGEDLEGIAIRGHGTIDGNGEFFPTTGHRIRPFMLRLVNCRDIVVEGITLQNAPTLVQHYLACERLALRDLTVYCHTNENNDGLDIDCCRDVRVTNCTIDADDDALALKSTMDRPCENVTIANCVLSSRCNAIKLGTETNGGFRNIAISNCTISSSLAPVKASLLRGAHAVAEDGERRGLAGIALEIVDGGHLDGIAISNIVMQGVAVAIFMRLGDRGRPFTEGMPRPGVGSFRNVVISNVVATQTSKIGCSITGIAGHCVENVSLNHLVLSFDGGGSKEQASREVADTAESVPESTMFGVLPAYGFYCRHVRHLKFHDVQLTTTIPDQRPSLVCDDVEDVVVDGWDTAAPTGASATIRLIQSREVLVRGCRPPANTGTFLRVEGELTEGATLAGNDLRHAERIVDRSAEVVHQRAVTNYDAQRD